MVEIRVKKRDGKLVPVDHERINETIENACFGLHGVSASQIAMKAHIQLYDGITTSQIQEMVYRAAADLIEPHQPDYAIAAGRLKMFDMRKRAFGVYEAPDFRDHINELVFLGKYDKEILEDYTPEEIDDFGDYIDHERDENYAYAAVTQLESKYLVKDRTTNQLFESPQQAIMLIGMCLFSKNYSGRRRYELVTKFYDAVSLFKISLPTPIMAGVRTPTRQFSSCVLIESDDSLKSINATASAIVEYASRRAGIGINAGAIRAKGSKIRGGEAFHTGIVPFLKYFRGALKSCSQGGLRGASSTIFYPFWHLEFEDLVVLKNNKGIEENRLRDCDYGVQLNKLSYTRLIRKRDITLFSPSDVPGLYSSFYADQEEFERLYEKYEQDPKIRKKKIPAEEFFSMVMTERAGTGRIYIQNIDHCNSHSPFDPTRAPIRQSNLCLEIALPTKPLNNIDDPDGEIALCTLAAYNLTAIADDEWEEVADLTVRALDSLLDYQEYPVKAAEKNKLRRTLGIGAINYAHWLAKNGYSYSGEDGNTDSHRLFERMQYWTMKASVKLAEEFGPCALFDETVRSRGILPIDTCKPDIDKFHKAQYEMDWDGLREEIFKHGMRNSTLTAFMPAETSAQISNSTNGIEIPRSIVSVKGSKDTGYYKQLVPDVLELGFDYETCWDMPDNEGYLQKIAIMQKFCCQTISANTYYDPAKFPGNKVPMSILIKDLLLAYKFGVKTLYYHNTRDGSGEDEDDGCASGACKI